MGNSLGLGFRMKDSKDLEFQARLGFGLEGPAFCLVLQDVSTCAWS